MSHYTSTGLVARVNAGERLPIRPHHNPGQMKKGNSKREKIMACIKGYSAELGGWTSVNLDGVFAPLQARKRWPDQALPLQAEADQIDKPGADRRSATSLDLHPPGRVSGR